MPRPSSKKFPRTSKHSINARFAVRHPFLTHVELAQATTPTRYSMEDSPPFSGSAFDCLRKTSARAVGSCGLHSPTLHGLWRFEKAADVAFPTASNAIPFFATPVRRPSRQPLLPSPGKPTWGLDSRDWKDTHRGLNATQPARDHRN
jgi:hypothetical protein